MSRRKSPTPYFTCGCRHPGTGKMYPQGACPRLGVDGHGGWYARYEATPGPDGQRRQPRVGPFASAEECERAVLQIVSDGPSVNQIVDDYLESLSCSVRTQENYERSLRHVRRRLGGRAAQGITEDDLRATEEYLLKAGHPRGGGLARRTVDLAICQLRAAYEFAVFQKRITRRVIPVDRQTRSIPLERSPLTGSKAG